MPQPWQAIAQRFCSIQVCWDSVKNICLLYFAIWNCIIGLGVDSHYAATIANDRKGYWFNAGNKAVNWALNKERLIGWGYYDLATAYQSMHVNY